MNRKITDRHFFNLSALALAEALLGKIFVHCTDDGRLVRRRITEVEAYCGRDDSASHAHRGLTKRTAPMFEEGGILYVYLCYGIFDLLNIVSGKKDEPEAVLIRGVEGATGPGRASRVLEITRALNRENLTASPRVWLEDDGFTPVPESIQRLKRVGIAYAAPEDQEKPWRLSINT